MYNSEWTPWQDIRDRMTAVGGGPDGIAEGVKIAKEMLLQFQDEVSPLVLNHLLNQSRPDYVLCFQVEVLKSAKSFPLRSEVKYGGFRYRAKSEQLERFEDFYLKAKVRI